MNTNIRVYLHSIGLYLKVATLCTLLCLTMQSCEKESHINPEEQHAISMTATSTNMTPLRAIIDSDTKLQVTDLGVYAHMQRANNEKILVFNNEKLYYDNGWKYDNIQYWIKSAIVYRFVAYSPYSPYHTGNVSYDMDEHTLKINNIPYWQEVGDAIEDVDYLIANSNGNVDDYLSSNSKGVDLDFDHILSQLVVNIKKDASLNSTEYILKKVDYINVPKGEEVATYTRTEENGSMGDIEIVTELNRFYGSKEISSDKNITLSHLTVPFDLNDKEVQIRLTYTVAGTERSKTVENTQLTKLAAGKHYELTLTFNGTEILHQLEIKDWSDIDIDEDPKYNW